MTSFNEILFAGTAMAIALCVIFTIRSLMDKKAETERNRLYGEDDEGSLTLTSLLEQNRTPGPLERFDRWFDEAVVRTGLETSPTGVVAVMTLLATVLGTGLYYWKASIGLAALGVVVGVGVPFLVVSILQARYRRQLQNLLPDAFHMLAGSLRGGQTLEQAIDFYSHQGAQPLAKEVSIAANQLKLGVTAESALKSAAARIKLLDFDILVSTVGLHRQTGGNLAMLLDRLADGVRDRNQFRGQFMAATAQGRVVAIAIGLAAPAILLVYALVEPDHVLAFFNSATGWSIVFGCAILQIIGIVWLWQILKIDY